jgi:hypothetical protein
MECVCTWKDGRVLDCCGAHTTFIRNTLTKALKDVEALASAEIKIAQEKALIFLESKDVKNEKDAIKHMASAAAMRAAIELFKNSFGVAVFEDLSPQKNST